MARSCSRLALARNRPSFVRASIFTFFPLMVSLYASFFCHGSRLATAFLKQVLLFSGVYSTGAGTRFSATDSISSSLIIW